MNSFFAARLPLSTRLGLHGATLLVGAFTWLYGRMVCSFICTLTPAALARSVLLLSAVHIVLRELTFRFAPGPGGRRGDARHAWLLSVATWLVTGCAAFGLHAWLHPDFPMGSHLRLALGYWLLGGGILAQVEYLAFESLHPSTGAPAVQLRERLGRRLIEGYVVFTTVPVLVLLLTLARIVGELGEDSPGLRRSLLEAAGVSAGITVAALAVAFAYGRSLRRDSERLLEAVRRVGGGDFQPAASTSRADELGLVAAGINDMAGGLLLRERIREAFGRFVSPQVANEFIEKYARSGRAAELGGSKRDVVLLFSDLRDFTPLSESLDPEDLIAVLNGYFAEMVAAIQRHGGMVDKYIGDAVLAVFGLTEGEANPAAAAVAAAVEMQQRLEGYNARLAARGLHLKSGIGLHAGQVVAGYLGSAERMEFTVIGHNVNVAARIESQAREPRPALLFSEEVARRLAGSLEVREVETASLKGVAGHMRLFTVVREGGGARAA